MNITYIVLIVSLAFNFIIFFYFKWYIKRKTSVTGLLPEYRTEVARLIAEIDTTTDRNLLLVEDAIKRLKEIQEDTDRRISVYVKELEKSRTGETLYTNLGRGIRAALKTETQGEQNANPVQLSLVRPNLESPVQTAPESVTAAAPTASTAAPPITPPQQPTEQTAAQLAPPTIVSRALPSSRQQIRSSIDTLANEGLAPEEIARRLDISIAEVDLAMNLRRGKK
ncbi:MAG: hypothetical protein LBI12_06145 [Treponema sp.]|jgi:hypothetical protein|nr:hypothetical protein [Treponema sp.]